MKRVWCLYRVSTKGQVDKDDIPMQRIACQEFVATKTDWAIENELYEKGVSGYKVSTNSRDAIAEIKAAALAKKFDVLLVFMFDRIGRREDETPFVVQWLVEQGIEVWSTREGEQRFDTHVDKLLNYIRYWQAAGESEKTAYRIKTRHQQMALSGVYRGGYIPYGYYTDFCDRINKKGSPVRDLLIDDSEAAIVQVIFHLVVDLGYGSNRVANCLNEQGIKTKKGTNLWRATGIRAIVHNPIYIGHMRFNGELSEAKEAYRIVSDVVYKQANALIASRSVANTATRHGARKASDSLLAGIIYCGECGQRMVYNKCHKYIQKAEGKSRYEWCVYRCYRKVNHRHSCQGPSTYVVYKIEDVVVNAVRQFFERLRLQPDETLLASVKSHNTAATKSVRRRAEAELEAARKDMKALEAEALKALTGKGGLDITMVNQMLPKCRERFESAKLEYDYICKAAEDGKAAEAVRKEEIDMMRSWADTFDTASLDAKRMVVAALIERIEVRRGYDITIRFRLTKTQFFGGLGTEKSG